MKVARETKYSRAVRIYVGNNGHATNAEILGALRLIYPELSATTVHRTTARLAERGVLAVAPKSKDGCLRYDATLTPHDHFLCEACEGIRDIDVADKLLPLLSEELGDCKVTGRLVIYGSCYKCVKRSSKT